MNFQLQISPFSANISIKRTPIKDKSGVPFCLSPSLPSHPPVKTEANESIHQKPLTNFPFPPPGFPIPQPCPQVKVPPHDDTKYADLYCDYCELELEFENLESSKIAIEKKLESKTKTAEDDENKTVELKKDLLVLKMENNMLKENTKDLEFDIKRLKGDYFELTQKVASQYNEYQEKIKELGSERTVVEERNLKKEEKKAKKKSRRDLKLKDSEKFSEVEIRSDECEQNNGIEFTCTICAKLCDIAELSSKSVPEEHDSCKDCSVEDTAGLTVSNTGIYNQTVNEPEKVKDIVNVVQYFWNGDLYVNNRLAIDYINMCNGTNHDCDKCSYISVMNEGVAPGGTGGWSMQFCRKFNFKLGDPFKDPPYMLGSLPHT